VGNGFWLPTILGGKVGKKSLAHPTIKYLKTRASVLMLSGAFLVCREHFSIYLIQTS
jgi:hypothetical protein